MVDDGLLEIIPLIFSWVDQNTVDEKKILHQLIW